MMSVYVFILVKDELKCNELDKILHSCGNFNLLMNLHIATTHVLNTKNDAHEIRDAYGRFLDSSACATGCILGSFLTGADQSSTHYQ